MNASAGTGVFVLSLMSIPISYLFNFLLYSNSIEAILFAGASTLVITAISVRLVLKKKAPRDPLFYVFATYAFLSVVNLIIGLEQDGIIDGFVTFYLKEGELQGHWFVLGGIPPNAGHSVHSWQYCGVCSQPAMRGAPPEDIQATQKKSLLQRPVDLLFAIYLLCAASFCSFRGLVALDCPTEWCQAYSHHYEPYLRDPSAYPRIQMVVNMLYFVPCYIITLYGLVIPGCEWIPDLTLVHAGAVAQAQFSHIGASLHTRTPFSYRVPADTQLLFLTVNVVYGLVPQVLSYRLLSNQAFFLKPPPQKTE
ncbi:transmembrane 6 superfamily member 1 isoform X3 [Clupea harengus]|uniref:Transmembrane 6 superfamily member 1 n=1 Tax=Clupea harengus TaxID=7950 RepID=A0A6P8FHY5_CLUHA|nr:transmembrane 6 superfamily member 1 isoform X3 [Clupea harengus]